LKRKNWKSAFQFGPYETQNRGGTSESPNDQVLRQQLRAFNSKQTTFSTRKRSHQQAYIKMVTGSSAPGFVASVTVTSRHASWHSDWPTSHRNTVFETILYI